MITVLTVIAVAMLLRLTWGPMGGDFSLGSNTGAIVGSALVPGLGTVLGMQYDAQKKAQRDADDAIAANQALSQAEIKRRQGNVSDIRAMYGIGPVDPKADPTRAATAQRMGAKLNAGINQQAGAVRDQGTQANLLGTSNQLTQANALAATTGTTGGSVANRAKAQVMGGYLQGRQNIATGAEGVRQSAQAGLNSDRAALENSAAGGSLNVDPTVAANMQAGQLSAARSMVPVNTMGNMLNSAVQYGTQSSFANALGYPTTNYLGQSSLTAGQTKTPGQFTQGK